LNVKPQDVFYIALYLFWLVLKKEPIKVNDQVVVMIIDADKLTQY